MSIELENVTKRFGAFTAVEDVTLSIPSGELTALLGPSGCGKTTLLRIIAGLEAPDAGKVRLAGEDVTAVAARRRNVGFVFQHYALFPHMTVKENVAFPLRVRGAGRAEIDAVAAELLHLVRLEGLAGRYPAQVSGGQKQRVALARALAARPRVLLLDEPFGALDAQVRRELRQWLRRLHDEIGVTSVFVTHDQEEALEVADRIVLVNRGRVEQEGPPDEVFEHPRTPFVLNFLGDVNVFAGSAGPEHGFARPHELDLERSPRDARALAATVRQVRALGSTVRVEAELGDGTVLRVSLDRARHAQLRLEPGEEVYVRPRRLHVFDEEGRARAAGVAAAMSC